jgi:DNA-binding ferritin-like protein (Dps family)
MSKPYTAKSLKGAEREVRRLRALVDDLREHISTINDEVFLLAKLSADTPQFDNPLDLYEAKKVRDRALLALQGEVRG